MRRVYRPRDYRKLCVKQYVERGAMHRRGSGIDEGKKNLFYSFVKIQFFGQPCRYKRITVSGRIRRCQTTMFWTDPRIVLVGRTEADTNRPRCVEKREFEGFNRERVAGYHAVLGVYKSSRGLC